MSHTVTTAAYISQSACSYVFGKPAKCAIKIGRSRSDLMQPLKFLFTGHSTCVGRVHFIGGPQYTTYRTLYWQKTIQTKSVLLSLL